MKKLLILFLFLTCSLLTYSQIQTINVGTVANDGTGTPLRTAFIYVNNNFSYHSGLLDLKANLASPSLTGTPLAPTAIPGTNTTQIATTAFTRIETSGQVADSLADLLDRAALVNTISPVWATDTANAPGSIITFTQLQNFSGGGAEGKFYYLSGTTDVEGYPATGDSTITHTDFIGRYVLFFREGNFQQQHPNNTQSDGFWYDNTLGRLTVKPIFGADEQLYVMATNTITFQHLIAEGEGGSPPTTPSPLLDSLVAYWQLDETGGVTATELIGGYNGTLYGATAGVAGKLGLGVSFDATDAIIIPYNSALSPTGDKMSIALWFKTDVLPSVAGHSMALFTLFDATTHNTSTVYVDSYDNKIYADFMNTTANEYIVNSTSAIIVGTWYHVVGICKGNGKAVELYVGYGEANFKTTGNVFSGTLHTIDDITAIGNDNIGYSRPLHGTIDDVGYWNSGHTEADVNLLFRGGDGRTHPFIEFMWLIIFLLPNYKRKYKIAA